MTNNLLAIPVVTALCLLGASQPAQAGSVTLSFTFNSLGSGVTKSQIQSYMQGVLSGYCTNCVTVTGNPVTERTYNGDGHVVGPGTASVTSLTLGTSEGGVSNGGSYDTFVRNQAGFTGFSFAITGLDILGVQFDYEIFPDGTCPSTSSCGSALGGGLYANQPDLTFSTNLGNVFHYYGVTPGGAAPSGNPGNPAGSSSLESPCTDTNSGTTGVSCSGTTEKAPQLIGTTAYLTTNVAGANTFNFIDWPATIGIDNFNLTINVPPVGSSAVPEPASMLLLGTGLAVIARRRKRNKA